jgi:hypothetical protein
MGFEMKKNKLFLHITFLIVFFLFLIICLDTVCLILQSLHSSYSGEISLIIIIIERISFEQKKKTLSAFLDISGEYDNVLIDVLCGNLCGLLLLLEMVRILWDLLHRRSLTFYYGGEAYTRRVGVKGLPQGSVLNPLLYNVGGSGIDAQMVRGVSLLQYADDLVIYASGFISSEFASLFRSHLMQSAFFYPIWAFP